MEKKIITNATFWQGNSMFISATFWAGLLCSEQDHKHTKKTSPRRIFADAHRDKNTLGVSSFDVSLWPHQSRPQKGWWLNSIPIGNCLVYLLSPQKSECHWSSQILRKQSYGAISSGQTFENLQHKSVGFLAPVFLIKGTNTNNDRLTTPCYSDLAPVRLQVKNHACSLPLQDEYIESTWKFSPKKLGNEMNQNSPCNIFKLPRQIPFACLSPKPLKPTNFHRVCQRRVCNPRHLPRNAQDPLRWSEPLWKAGLNVQKNVPSGWRRQKCWNIVEAPHQFEGAEKIRERINIGIVYPWCLKIPGPPMLFLGCWTIGIAYEDEAIMEKVESHITSYHICLATTQEHPSFFPSNATDFHQHLGSWIFFHQSISSWGKALQPFGTFQCWKSRWRSPLPSSVAISKGLW